MRSKEPNMSELNAVYDSEDPGPIAVINLLKFNEIAQYDEYRMDDKPATLTGREAYMIYVDAFIELMRDYGAHSLFLGDTEAYIAGSREWDAGWVNYFPSRAIFKAIGADSRYMPMYVHRQAGLAFSDVIVTKPLIPKGA